MVEFSRVFRVPAGALLISFGFFAAIVGSAVVARHDASAQVPLPVQSVLGGSQELATALNGKRWVIRNEHAANDEHSHAGGFIYAVRGAAHTMVEGQEVVTNEGQAIWVYEGVPHIHRLNVDSQILTFTLESESELAAAPALFSTKEISSLQPVPYLARLAADMYPAGAGTPPHRHFGPEAVYVREGEFQLNYAGSLFRYPAGQGYYVEPTVPHQLRNVSNDASRLFSMSLIPLSRPSGEVLPPSSIGQ
jgi:quercetin dioxygenase-like cupin family protein